MTSHAIEVRMTPTMGRGVFAARPLRHGEVLGAFHTIRLPPHEVAAMQGTTLSHFWFEDDADGSAFVVLGWIEMINHSASPNADRSWQVTPEGEVVTLFATADVATGQQLFIDYHFEPRADNPAWASTHT
jgi:uncharacterized protein